MKAPFLPLALLLATAGCATKAQQAQQAPTPPASASHAWATFDRSGIKASGAGGIADRASGRALTIHDPVRIASITKLHVALGVMRLVEQGKLDLDRDVSGWLGWKLRNPAHPDVPITLRQLLSHRSSIRDGIEYWTIPATSRLEDAFRAPAAWDLERPPGAWFRYSNLAFPVVASAMEGATGERFDALMQRLVLTPLKLEACFNWSTCRDDVVARAVVLYGPEGEVRRDDLRGRRPDCPGIPAPDGGCDLSGYRPGTNGAVYSPQGGLRISVADLAKVGAMLLRDGGLADGTRFLRPESLAEMERLHWRFDGSNGETEENFYCGYGLAVQVLAQCAPADDPFGDGRLRTGHAGEAYGLRSGFWIDRRRGRGIAYFATGQGDSPAKGRSSYRAVEEWLASKERR